LLVAALSLRIFGLELAPLAPDEAAMALESADAVQGSGWPQMVESPLLLMGNALLFSIFGAGDGIARLLPGLAGAGLVALPLLWRRRLGNVGALVAAGILACSPLGLFASRQVDATMLGLIGAALLLTALALDDADLPGDVPRSVLIAVGLALGLTGGPAFYMLLIPGLVAWGLYCWMVNGRLAFPFREWAVPALVGLVVALLISVGLGLRLNGWSGIADGLASWLGRGHVDRAGHPGASLLLLYEPLTLFLALAGLGWTVARKDTFPLLAAAWAALTLLLVLVHPAASVLAWGTLIFPLALLAGYGVQCMVADVAQPALTWMLLQTAIGFIFWQPVGLALAGHANAIANPLPTVFLVLGALVLLALHVLIAFLFVFVIPQPLIWRGIVLGLAAALLVLQFGFAWALAFVHSSSPAELAIEVAGSPDLRTLCRMLDEIAVQRQQRRDTLSVTLVEGNTDVNAVMRWALRDFARVQIVPDWPTDMDGVVITPEAFVPASAPMAGWEGMRFVATTRATQVVPSCQTLFPPACADLARWYLYRTALPATVVPEYVILWMKP